MGIDTPQRNRRMHLVEKKPPRPLAERGRIMYAEDIQQLYGNRPDGKPRKSRNWIHEHFAPDDRHKDGRTIYWWETDALAWFDSQRSGAA
jgi:hypothetical protein